MLQGEASSYLRWSKVRAQPDKIRAALVSREAVAVKVGCVMKCYFVRTLYSCPSVKTDYGLRNSFVHVPPNTTRQSTETGFVICPYGHEKS